MPTVAQWIRERLIEAEPRGCVCSDLHKERKQDPEPVYFGGTYDSFHKLWGVLYRLGWIEKTGEEEVSFIKGTTIEFSRKGSIKEIPEGNVPRIYFRITPKGLSIADWGDPIAIKYPHFTGYKRCKPYRKKKKGLRPVGRPRGTYTGRKRAGLPPIAHKEPTASPL
jgi:hypothetical protein